MISPLTSPKGLGSLNPRNNSVELCSHRLELRLQSSSLAPERRVAIRDGRPVIRLTRDCVACPFPSLEGRSACAAAELTKNVVGLEESDDAKWQS
jgi:hypothetical protein